MDEVERLRRVAYGPGASAAERAEAEAALRELEARAGAGGAVEAAQVSDEGAQESFDLTDKAESVIAEGGGAGVTEEDAGSIWGRRIRVGWLVPIVAGALVVGVLGTLQSTGRFLPTVQFGGPATSPSSPAQDGSERMLGDLEAADAWFVGSGTASDAYPFSGLLQSNDIDPYEVRFALAGGDAWNVWVGRSSTDELCLLIADASDQSGAAGCVERVQFARGGLHLALNGRTAYWYGDSVTADPDDEPEAQVPSIPGSGPGDVEAALQWFAAPRTAHKAYPYPDTLPAIGIADEDIRAVGVDIGSKRDLWLARQDGGGFCVLVTDEVEGTSNYACAPATEFEASGLGLAIEGFAVFWDGGDILMAE